MSSYVKGSSCNVTCPPSGMLQLSEISSCFSGTMRFRPPNVFLADVIAEGVLQVFFSVG